MAETAEPSTPVKVNISGTGVDLGFASGDGFKRLAEDEAEEHTIKEVAHVSTGRSGSGALPWVGAAATLALCLATLQTLQGLQRRVMICAIPSVMMMFMSIVAYKVQVSTNVMSAFQHLGAGLLTSAVAVELVPAMMDSPNDINNLVGMIIGFAAGIGLLTLLAKMCGGGEEEDEEEEDDKLARTPRGLTTIAHAERAAGGVARPYPYALVVAVTTDAAVDGLLIGVASGASLGDANAGLILSLALAIEMGFLGLTFATTMSKQPGVRGWLSVVLPPVVLQLGALGGALVASALYDAPATHTALLAFGSAALLYLVVVELLHEAHGAMNNNHIWWVELMFFVGFLTAVVLEKLMRA